MKYSLAICVWFLFAVGNGLSTQGQDLPFGSDFPQLDSAATGEWWNKRVPPNAGKKKGATVGIAPTVTLGPRVVLSFRS